MFAAIDDLRRTKHFAPEERISALLYRLARDPIHFSAKQLLHLILFRKIAPRLAAFVRCVGDKKIHIAFRLEIAAKD